MAVEIINNPKWKYENESHVKTKFIEDNSTTSCLRAVVSMMPPSVNDDRRHKDKLDGDIRY